MLIDKLGERLNIDMRGKVGRGGGFGRVCFGYNNFGLYSFFFGIYTKKLTKNGKRISKMKFYRSKNPRTLFQQNWRAVYAYAVLLWQQEKEEIKAIFNENAKRKKISGYNLYVKEFLGKKPHGFGKVKFGYGF